MIAAKYSIKDLERLTGIKAHTLRIWEKRYKVVFPKRTPTNIRYYSDEDLRKLLNISILNRYGYKISKIADLSNEDLGSKIISITSDSTDTEDQIESLVISMLEMDENKFEKILTTLIINYGFEDAFLKILSPFFEKIGVLWQVGTIIPAQEHFITNLIRQKMIVAIDGLVAPSYRTGQKSFLLYLPEDELHEIGLLFYSYLIQKLGHKVIYFGQMLPFEDLKAIKTIQKPDALLTVFTTSKISMEVEEYLNKLTILFSDQEIYVSGLQFKPGEIKIPKGINLIESMSLFKKEITH